MTKLFIFTIVILVGTWLMFSPLFARPLYNLILFHPSIYPEGAYNIDVIHGIQKKEAVFKAPDGSKLHGWWFENPQAGPVVLVSHGNGGNITHRGYLAKALIRSGASVFLYDYRGYGWSGGKSSVEGICEDGRAAYDYLTNVLHIDPQRIVLYGESLGTGVTCNLAANVPCKAVILQSGYASLRRAGMQRIHFLNLYPLWLFPNPELDNCRYVRKEHPPLLVVHGKNDTLLPCTLGQEVFADACEPKTMLLLPTAEHNDVPDQPEFVPSVTKFLASLDVPAPVQSAKAISLPKAQAADSTSTR
jgi:fermentation-respiration switch protein FrsA (DUF1100 family)